jgi:hypothetical protein
MVTFKGMNQFWIRHDRQKSPMSIHEIKDICLKVEGLMRKRVELHLAVIDEIHRLAGKHINNLIFRYYPQGVQKPFKPSDTFLLSLTVLPDKVKNLFSASTFDAFEKMIQEIPPLPDKQQQQAIQDFIKKKDTALQALYKEVGVF